MIRIFKYIFFLICLAYFCAVNLYCCYLFYFQLQFYFLVVIFRMSVCSSYQEGFFKMLISYASKFSVCFFILESVFGYKFFSHCMQNSVEKFS